MSLASSKDQVEDFLRNLREKIGVIDIAFRPRDKNNEALRILDITPLKRIEYLKGLTYKDYFSGPNKDTYDSDRPDYYEFGVEINGLEVYIKISLGLPNKRVDCMSFHIAAKPIKYPYKNK